MLREWQHESVSLALEKYQSGQRHFQVQATPGAGKTVMAAEIAKILLETNEIDLVLCFSPSLTIAQGIQKEGCTEGEGKVKGREMKCMRVGSWKELQRCK